MSRGAHGSAVARVRSRLLTGGAVLGTATLLLVGGCLALGLRPMVVVSGSMSPAIPAGSLALARSTDAGQVEVGDVVTVLRADGSRVMHRVVAAEPAGDRVALRLKGDANATPDPEPYVVESVGVVRGHVPLLGHPVSWLSSPGGLLLLGAGACGLVVFAFRRDSRVAAGGRRVARAAAVLPWALATVLAGTTGAWFTDVGAVTAGPLQTHLVASQAQPACQDVNGLLILGNIARVTWAQVDRRYEYHWELRRADNGFLAASGAVGAGVAQGGTVTLDLWTGLVGVDTNYNVVVRARLASTTSWIAATTTTTPVRRASILILGTAFRCGHA
ncbi:signal peptidase I [Nocardioides sp. SYSU DS0651]|uniref:signal peptidase I n=1 Tax=Nocardioides sp. SYSU DS0651 TaxID=3415955 RepID=UPI003F4BADD3